MSHDTRRGLVHFYRIPASLAFASADRPNPPRCSNRAFNQTFVQPNAHTVCCFRSRYSRSFRSLSRYLINTYPAGIRCLSIHAPSTIRLLDSPWLSTSNHRTTLHPRRPMGGRFQVQTRVRICLIDSRSSSPDFRIYVHTRLSPECENQTSIWVQPTKPFCPAD